MIFSTLLLSLFCWIFLIYPVDLKIPVIIDTDVGTDIDDTWAVAYLLQQPDIEIQLILTATHNTLARTKYLAKFLTLAGKSKTPIGIGVQTDNLTGPSMPFKYIATG
jgi:inosine-uridine nucleoside N-ribohydrolase